MNKSSVTEVKTDFLIIGSAHTLIEIRIKEKQKVDAIFLSSFFKKNNNYLGLYNFLNLICLSNKKFVLFCPGTSSPLGARLSELTDRFEFRYTCPRPGRLKELI